MQTFCRALVIGSLISNACLADETGTAVADSALGDLVVQGLDQPLRLRLYATHDDVPWNAYGTTARSEQLQSLFRQLDADTDGNLTPDEARRLPRPEALGRTGPSQGVNVAFNFRVLDANEDGAASLDELRAYLEEFSQPSPTLGFVAVRTERNPGDLFSALDADRNRRLTDDEWSAIPKLLERDRDGNRVVTPDELRSPSAELYGPEFVAVPIAQRGTGAQPPLVATLEPPGPDEPDGVVRLRISDAVSTPPAVIELQLNDRARALGVTIDADASPRVRLRIGRRFVEFGSAQSGPRGNTALSAALLRQFDALAETLGRPLTLKDNLPLELKSSFTVADANGDGSLERTELERCIAGFVAATASSAASRLTIMFVPERRGLSPLIDVNRDGRLSLREIRGLPTQIASLIDDNGTIGLNEVPTVAAIIFCRGVSGDAADPALLSNSGPTWFIRADQNSDGDLDAAEFMGPPEIFASLDANGDGWLELDEALRMNEAELIPAAEAQP